MDNAPRKFRAWDIERREWAPAGIVGSVMYEIIANPKQDATDSFILTQYTGMTDRNGYEIFEGDFVALRDLLLLVSWRNGSYHVNFEDDIEYSAITQERMHKFSVVGNIFQNPDLQSNHESFKQ